MARDRAKTPLANRTTFVYRAFGICNELLYVGISQSWRLRLEGHRKNSMWWTHVRHIEVQEFADRASAFAMESWSISNENPIFNLESQSKHAPGAEPIPAVSFGRWVDHWTLSGDPIEPKEVEIDALVQGR